MDTLMLPFTPRFIILTICSVVTALLLGIGLFDHKAFDVVLLPLVVFGALTALGVRDLIQKRHAVLRNYPISAHMRFLLEEIRPEMRQYFFESEKDGKPFSRDIRAVVYQRAKMDLDKRPFGTQNDVYQEGYEWMHHSVAPKPMASEKFRITIGGPDCTQPYSASIFNVSAMSFGALSPNAVRALNGGARKGGFAQDTGEGGFSPYHREMGGDIIWEIGSGYFGCRTADGNFDPDKFQKLATIDQIKMVELKMSQGAKPGHGGVLPAAKVSQEISEIRGVPMGQDCISPPYHKAFSTPIGLMQFIAEMRRLSGGKPAGFKLCIGHPWEFLSICKAMLETGIYPDFIVVDGNEGGTGAAPLEFMDNLGMPMREGVNFVHNALIGINARDRIKIGAAGKIATAFDIARAMAIGADWCNAARAFMFSIGCIQSLSCHTDRCPTGVTSQDPTRNRALVVPDKLERVYNYHHATLHALAELTAAGGFAHPQEMLPMHFSRRVSGVEVMSFDHLYPSLRPGELINGTDDARFKRAWAMARAETFAAAN
ncbi:FMN-binding glutamate synthase family protein [Bradyrhizobium sp. U87765 SZCCT0131]|nr:MULTISPECIES: FMN-binding glutamate synthase family protein [unclassified Bradyrhizobium]MBR1217199.1 FMN-binding glutamate synthase family protein [Bradyrhizobium sp. U87765 SZCCT0131]MBR1259045.1 FMN-binding glutamate synthase family protein [Bradyrhizobium sp. U87765 SZCCT0134]MBR1305186.1 FMN-binding glutamate synthase family protein [Bradyrhizobium sp. U87765 SZCCT0110]MBR1320972.1 FMN-binding glutamate synthase family protein [Bradyrhizobium sp. U87765 SZCCT0109]MBR1350374.1 FMN-bindi